MSLLVDLRILQPQIISALRDRVLANRERQRRQREIRAAREEGLRQSADRERQQQRRRQDDELLASRFRPDDPTASQPGYPVAQIIASRTGSEVNLRCVASSATASFNFPADNLTITGAVPASLQAVRPQYDWQGRTLEQLGLEGTGLITGLPGGIPLEGGGVDGGEDLADAAAFVGINFETDEPIVPPDGRPFFEGNTVETTEVTTELAHVCLFALLPVRGRTAVFVASVYAQTTTETQDAEYTWQATTYESSVDPGGFVSFSRIVTRGPLSTTTDVELVAHKCFAFNDVAVREVPAPEGLATALDAYYDSGDYASLEGSLPASYGITYRTNLMGGFGE